MKATQNLKSRISNIYKGMLAVTLGMALAFASPFMVDVFADEATELATTFVPIDDVTALRGHFGARAAAPRRGSAGLNITGELPRAAIPEKPLLNEQLNARFDAQRDSFIQAHRERTANFHFTFTTHVSDNFLSIVIRMEARGITTTTVASTTVIDSETFQIINLNHLNPNMVQIVNMEIQDRMRDNPRGHVASFAPITASHPFYLSGNNINVLFASGTLVIGNRLESIRLNIQHIHDRVIDADMLRNLSAEQYNTLMVRIAAVEEFDGFRIHHDQTTGIVTVFRDDAFITYVTIDQNEYTCRFGRTRNLESAPLLIDRHVYVPVSFFREVLGIAVTFIDGEEPEILMSKWRRPPAADHAGSYRQTIH